MTAVVELRDVVKWYADQTPVLTDISLAIEDREFVAVTGPSGSGKSTMLNIMGTLDRASRGNVRVAGHDVGSLGDRQLSALRARHIGFVFQHFHLAPLVPVLESTADGLLYAGVSRANRLRAARDALTRVGLAHRLDHRPHELSGGERQRVAIARAVLGRPRLLLADEPTGNLDSAAGAAVMRLLTELNTEGTTVVVITHDREVAGQVRRKIEVRDGRLA